MTLPGGMGETSTTINYAYDPLYRLTAADYSNGDNYHYAYDAVGNRLQQETSVNSLQSTVNYQYDIANRLANVDNVNYTWDANGNLVNDGTSTYTYDPANRMSSVVQGNNSFTYNYNGLGDRLQQTVNGHATDYTLDLNTGLTQVMDDGTNTYTYGLDRISQQNGATAEYFLGDALGSVRQLTDASDGITLSKSYDPYGNVISSAGSSTSIFGYTHEQADSYIKLIYLRSRMYDPATGRFLTKDPWQGDYNKPASYNAWLYVYANPVNDTDPTGQITVDQSYEADQIVKKWYQTYDITIKKDWGPSPVPVPMPPGISGISSDISCGEGWNPGLWELSALEAIQNGMQNYSVRWGASRFRSIFGGVTFYSIYEGNNMHTWGHRDVEVSKGVMNAVIMGYPYVEVETVHEFAHIWDNTCNDCLSKGMMKVTGGHQDGNTYIPGAQPPTKYAAVKGRREDWAESVTAYFYPDYAEYPSWTTIRKYYVEDALNSSSFPPR